jgi:hypothetical protein
MMTQQMKKLEAAARMSMGDYRGSDPLPPGPNYSPYGYFRLGILVFAVVVAILFLFEIV